MTVPSAAGGGETRLTIEVAYARPDEQALVAITLPAGATVRDAIEQSGLRQRFPEIDVESQQVGIFGRLARLDDALRDGERVEIYRPLTADPKEMRRRRAQRDREPN